MLLNGVEAICLKCSSSVRILFDDDLTGLLWWRGWGWVHVSTWSMWVELVIVTMRQWLCISILPWVVLFVCQCLFVGPEAGVNVYFSACLGSVAFSFSGFRVTLVSEFTAALPI